MIKCGFSKGHVDVQALDQEEKEEFSSLEKDRMFLPQIILIPNRSQSPIDVESIAWRHKNFNMKPLNEHEIKK